MTWKERRTVTILASILAALFAILLVVLGIRYQQNRPISPDSPNAPSTATGDTPVISGTYTQITYSNDLATLTFSKNESGDWFWADGPDFPLNSLTIDAIAQELANLKFQQTLPMTDPPETYGLDNPSATLSATDTQNVTHTLSFGKATTDGDSRYIQMNDDDSTVYIIADTLYQYLQTPIYDMCRLPDLPALNEASLTGLTIQGPVPEATEEEGEPPAPLTTLLVARHSGEHDTLWFNGTDNVSQNPRVTGLLEDLASLTIDRCVDYHPSEDASRICGFDAPSAVLTITYTSEGGGEQTLVITAGNRFPDGSGRYIRLNGEDPIYFLRTDFLDPLMTIAASGLAES